MDQKNKAIATNAKPNTIQEHLVASSSGMPTILLQQKEIHREIKFEILHIFDLIDKENN